MLPTVLLATAFILLVLALVAFWQSVRALSGHGVDEISAAIGGDRAALIDEKNSLLSGLKDLEFERAVGKVSDADWKRLDASYRARAKDVLAELDKDLGPWREKAEKLVSARLGKSAHAPDAKGAGKAQKKAKAKHAEPAAREPAEAPQGAPEPAAVAEAEAAPAAKRACPSCEASNDADAVFCKKCAARLAASSAEEAS